MATSYAITQTFAGWHGTTAQGNTPDVVTLKNNVNTALASVATNRDADNAVTQTNVHRVPLSLTANGTWATYTALPLAATITSIKLVTPTVFASMSGTVLLTVKKTNSSGNTILSAATYDLETASADTSNAITLTSTGADKAIAAGGLIYIAVVSNNADATGPAESAAALIINHTLDLS